MGEKVLYDLIRRAAQEIRTGYELFDFYANLTLIVYMNCLYDFDTNFVYELLIRI